MDDLRQSVQSAVYEQKDPLLIYKFESFELFKKVLAKINNDVVSFIVKASLPQAEAPSVTQGDNLPRQKAPKTQTSRGASPEQIPTEQNYHDPSKQERKKPEPVRVEKKIGRNERVEIQNIMTGEKKSIKFKQAEPLVDSGQWVVVKS
jgi:preprotein translocase subunit SecA